MTFQHRVVEVKHRNNSFKIKVKDVLGTLNVNVGEWRMEMKQLELETDVLVMAAALQNAGEIEREFETDVLEIATSLENTNLGSPLKSECQGDIEQKQDADPESDSDKHGDEEEEGEGVLLFRVGLALEADDDDNIEVVLLHLEDLRDLAPELLTKFLQSKLRFIDEDSVDD